LSGAHLVGGHCIESSELLWKCSEHWSRRACSRGAACVQALAARLSAAHLEDIARLSGAHLVGGHCIESSELRWKCSEHWSRRACSRGASCVQALAARLSAAHLEDIARLSGAHLVVGHCMVASCGDTRCVLPPGRTCAHTFTIHTWLLTTTIGLWGKCSEHWSR
jgi:hypothetical protein